MSVSTRCTMLWFSSSCTWTEVQVELRSKGKQSNNSKELNHWFSTKTSSQFPIPNYKCNVPTTAFSLLEKFMSLRKKTVLFLAANCGWQVSSLSETKAHQVMQQKASSFIQFNQRQLSRIYPSSYRVDSSNFNPQPFWNAGCQLGMNVETIFSMAKHLV